MGDFEGCSYYTSKKCIIEYVDYITKNYLEQMQYAQELLKEINNDQKQ